MKYSQNMSDTHPEMGKFTLVSVTMSRRWQWGLVASASVPSPGQGPELPVAQLYHWMGRYQLVWSVLYLHTWSRNENTLCYLITTPSCSPLFWPLYPLKISVSQKNVSIPCIQIGTQRERELETAEILLLVCVTSCSTTSTEVTTDERMRGFFSFQI